MSLVSVMSFCCVRGGIRWLSFLAQQLKEMMFLVASLRVIVRLLDERSSEDCQCLSLHLGRRRKVEVEGE